MNSHGIVRFYGMTPHPEGGFYRENYRSLGTIDADALPEVYGGPRAYSTAILFLLHGGEYSHLHRIHQDEVWHFYLGQPLRLALLSPDGATYEIILGQDILQGQHLQFVVPGGYWFGATPCTDKGFSLVGCTVAPGFEFADFELGVKDELEQLFPTALPCIREFCCKSTSMVIKDN